VHLSAHAVRRPVATTMLLLAAVLLGAVSLPRLEVALLPEARSGALVVWIGYPDGSLAEVEEAVARPAEEALLGVPGVRSVRTRVVSGGASFRVQLLPGTDPDVVALGLRERLDGVRWSFPTGVERPLVLGGAGEEAPIQVLALAAGDVPAAADWAETVLRPRLEQIDGVARAQVIGAPEPEIRVTPDPDRLRVTGIGVDAIAAALRDANVDATGGTVRRLGMRYALRLESRLATAQDVAGVVLTPGDDASLRVGDLAAVTDGWAEPRGFVRLDGRPAVGILVYRSAGANLLKVARDVRHELDLVGGEFPELSLAVVSDSSPFVRQSVAGVWQAVWLGGLLAFGVLFLFLREVRSPLFLCLALPVSVIATFAVLDLLGTSLNLMSLGGIALGVGMLVDNGIVCLENIHRLRGKGHDPAEAAATGAREIALPTLASTLTTCAVFVPLAFVPGAVGALFRDQAVAVSVALLVSWLVALTLLPMLAARFPGPVDEHVRRPFFGLYHRLLHASLARPAVLLGGTAVLVTLGGVLFLRAPRELLPEVATDHLEIRVALPAGHDATATDEAARTVETWLAARSEVASVFAAVGDVGALDPGDESRLPHRGTLRLVLAGGASRHARRTLERDLHAFAATVPGLALEFVPDAPELAAILSGGGAALTCDVAGPDDAKAEEIARGILADARAAAGGGGVASALADVRLVASEREAQIRFAPREDALWRYGLKEGDVVPAVRAMASGYEVTRLRRFDEEVPLVIRFAGEEDPAAARVLVRGRELPVAALFDVVTELAPATRWRENQARVASIRWDGRLRDVAPVQEALQRAAGTVPRPAGYTVTFGGGWRETRETASALVRAFALSAGLVLLILAAQFESVRLPVLILVAVPLALPGVGMAVLASGGTVNALSGIAMVVLVGIVVNDAILKVDLLRRFRAEGRPRREAIDLASRRRYRPIVMTTLTTAIGLAPLFFGRGAELRAPLAGPVIGGLLSATALTLLVVPVLFERIAGAFAKEPS
jgi:hydrophobic/amphiphilic exporter-1 (mainly G- bacteria), HAE1 family